MFGMARVHAGEDWREERISGHALVEALEELRKGVLASGPFVEAWRWQGREASHDLL